MVEERLGVSFEVVEVPLLSLKAPMLSALEAREGHSQAVGLLRKFGFRIGGVYGSKFEHRYACCAVPQVQ